MVYKSVFKSVYSPSGFSVSSYQSSGGGPTYLLDTYTGAAAAYSLRRLSTSYTGPVVQVRRSGDSAEDTFTATEVSDGTLAAWVTAGGGTEDGFVKTWYDQSGNTNDASQTTANNQPKIVASGVVVEYSGSNCISNYSAASGKRLIVPLELRNQAVSMFGVYGADSSESTGMLLSDRSSVQAFVCAMYDGNASLTLNGLWSGSIYANNALVTGTRDNAHTAYHTGNLIVATAIGNASDNAAWGGSGTVVFAYNNATTLYSALCFYPEIILYLSDQSSNRTGIESNIASHYGITLS